MHLLNFTQIQLLKIAVKLFSSAMISHFVRELSDLHGELKNENHCCEFKIMLSVFMGTTKSTPC